MVILGLLVEVNRTVLVILEIMMAGMIEVMSVMVVILVISVLVTVAHLTDFHQLCGLSSPLTNLKPPVVGTRVLKNSHLEPNRFLHCSFLADNADQILITEFL